MSNLLPDPGFEETPSQWTLGGDSGHAEIQAAVVEEGSYALRLGITQAFGADIGTAESAPFAVSSVAAGVAFRVRGDANDSRLKLKVYTYPDGTGSPRVLRATYPMDTVYNVWTSKGMSVDPSGPITDKLEFETDADAGPYIASGNFYIDNASYLQTIPGPPLTQITGGVGSIVAGRVVAWLYPPGQVGADPVSGDKYKYGFRTSSPIMSSQVTSLSLAQTQSLSNAQAYYLVELFGLEPRSYMRQLWRVETELPELSVNSVTVLANTPVYERTYY